MRNRIDSKPGFQTLARDHGFTFIEVLIVFTIMIVMSMVALPQLFEVVEEYRLTAVAREVTGNLSNTRILAITQNSDYRLLISDSGTYVVEEDVAGTWTTRATFEMPDGFTIGTAGDSVVFHRWGNATPVATLSITNENNTVAQVVTANSGRSYVQ